MSRRPGPRHLGHPRALPAAADASSPAFMTALHSLTHLPQGTKYPKCKRRWSLQAWSSAGQVRGGRCGVGGAGAALSPCVGSWGRQADTGWHSQRPPAETRARSPALGALPEGMRAPCVPRPRLRQGCDCSLRFPAFTTAHGPSLLPGGGGGEGRGWLWVCLSPVPLGPSGSQPLWMCTLLPSPPCEASRSTRVLHTTDDNQQIPGLCTPSGPAASLDSPGTLCSWDHDTGWSDGRERKRRQ